MACEFCFQCKSLENKVGRFQSQNGIEYIVNMNIANTSKRRNSYYQDFNIRITSNTVFNAVVDVELFESNSQNLEASKKNTVLDYETVFTFQNYGWTSCTCIISVIPLLEMQNPQSSSPAKPNHILKPMKKGTVVEKKLEQLSADMKTLLLKDNRSDVILSDESTDFPAHKLVLSVRSPVFERMFQSPMKEKRENRVTISDISADVLKELLSYIYTGVVHIKEEGMARNLYVAADKYGIQDLKNVFSVYLKDVNLDSVLDALILASLYGDKTLKQSALDFIAKDFSQVKAQQSWEKFIKENQILTIELLSFVVEKK